MPDTVEHRVEMHRLAQERRKAGKPAWAHKVDLSGVFHDEELGFEQRRDAIVDVIRRSQWFRKYTEGDDLPRLVEELSDTEDIEEFDAVFDAIYDIADYDRAWIKTF